MRVVGVRVVGVKGGGCEGWCECEGWCRCERWWV